MSRTKTWVVNVRVDIRTLATLMKFYQHQGLADRNKSIAIRLATEHFKSLVINHFPQFETQTFEEAVRYLEEQRILDLQEDFAGKFSLVKELQKESLDFDLSKIEKKTKHEFVSPNEQQQMIDDLDRRLRQLRIQEETHEQEGKETEDERDG